MTQAEPRAADLGSIEVSVGFETHPDGAASLRVDGDGSVRVETARAGERASFEGKIDPESARKLVENAAELQRAARPGKAKGLPDEARYTMTVTQANGASRSLEAWESDLEVSPLGRQLLTDLRLTAARVSDQKAVL